jgi:hypothetical protein
MKRRWLAGIAVGVTGVAVLGVVSASSSPGGSAAEPSPTQVFVPSGSPLPDGVVMPVIPGDPIPGSVYERPFGDGALQVREGDPIEMPFEIYPPSSLGTPTSVWVDNTSDAVHAQVAWVYTDPQLGTFDVIEGVAIEDQAELEAPVGQPKGCTVTTDAAGGSQVECTTSTFEMFTLESGARALISIGDSTQNIRWIEPLKGLSAADLEGHGPSVVLEIKILASTDSGMSMSDLESLANRV